MFYWMLLDFTAFYSIFWILIDFNGGYLVLLDF